MKKIMEWEVFNRVPAVYIRTWHTLLHEINILLMIHWLSTSNN